MADKTRQIGGLHESTNEKGTLYKLIMFINSADATTFTPTPVGKPPVAGETGTAYNTQIVAIVPAGILPTACYIYDFEKRPVGDHWIFTILACSTGYDWGGSSGGGLVASTILQRSLAPDGRFKFEYSWFGITQWSQHELYQEWATQAQRQAAGESLAPIAQPKLYNAAGTAASSADDLVFVNAGIGTQGTVQYRSNLTPFTSASFVVANVPIDYAGKTVSTLIYHVKIYRVQGSFWDYVKFTGANPSGAWASGITPDGTWANAAMWRADYQRIEEDKKTFGGNSYDMLERKMELVPYTNAGWNLRWDTAKMGEWVW